MKVCVEPFTCSNDGVHEKCDPSLCCEVDVQLGVLSQQGLQSTHITRVTCFHHTLHQWVGGGHDDVKCSELSIGQSLQCGYLTAVHKVES